MRFLAMIVVAIALGVPGESWAQPKEAAKQTPKEVAKEAPKEVLAPAKISAMAWMKGYWAGEGYGGTVETFMGPPKAGVMIGTFRHMRPDGNPGYYEICAFEEYQGSLRFIVKHFHPSWVGWEEKDRALQAKLARLGPDEWQFGNMLVKRTGKDAFTMELTITKDGTTRKETLRFKRQPL